MAAGRYPGRGVGVAYIEGVAEQGRKPKSGVGQDVVWGPASARWRAVEVGSGRDVEAGEGGTGQPS